MMKDISSFIIWSQDYKRLADWYIEKLNLTIVRELSHPQDTAVQFKLGNAKFWIGQHSQVKGKNNDSHRFMVNFVVDSVEETYEKLQKKGVKFLAKPFKAPTLDKYFATFYDLDDNILQIVGPK